MSRKNDWIHDALDKQRSRVDSASGETPGSDTLATYRQCLSLLEGSRKQAPKDFASSVMARLPEPSVKSTWRERLMALWPADGRWVGPSLAGAMVVTVLAFGLHWMGNVGERQLATTPALPEQVVVEFEVHLPDANRVELVGSFNDWRQGQIVLDGPDASGHWSASIALPSGRHEYFFLVNDKEWMTDPGAAAYRPDGFGRENALLEL